MTDKEKIKWHEEKWGTNEEPSETPRERPHCDNDSLKNQGKNFNEKSTCKKNKQITCDCVYCYENPTCYKQILEEQLQRKTAECEELRKQLMETKTFDLFADKIVEKVNTDAVLLPMFKKHLLYKQALDEIERIAKTHNDIPDLPCGMDDCKYPKCRDDLTNNGKTCMRSGLIKIADIISRAKGEQNAG